MSWVLPEFNRANEILAERGEISEGVRLQRRTAIFRCPICFLNYACLNAASVRLLGIRQDFSMSEGFFRVWLDSFWDRLDIDSPESGKRAFAALSSAYFVYSIYIVYWVLESAEARKLSWTDAAYDTPFNCASKLVYLCIILDFLSLRK